MTRSVLNIWSRYFENSCTPWQFPKAASYTASKHRVIIEYLKLCNLGLEESDHTALNSNSCSIIVVVKFLFYFALRKGEHQEGHSPYPSPRALLCQKEEEKVTAVLGVAVPPNDVTCRGIRRKKGSGNFSSLF